jgi:hypothetical protein
VSLYTGGRKAHDHICSTFISVGLSDGWLPVGAVNQLVRVSWAWVLALNVQFAVAGLNTGGRKIHDHIYSTFISVGLLSDGWLSVGAVNQCLRVSRAWVLALNVQFAVAGLNVGNGNDPCARAMKTPSYL